MEFCFCIQVRDIMDKILCSVAKNERFGELSILVSTIWASHCSSLKDVQNKAAFIQREGSAREIRLAMGDDPRWQRPCGKPTGFDC